MRDPVLATVAPPGGVLLARIPQARALRAHHAFAEVCAYAVGGTGSDVCCF